MKSDLKRVLKIDFTEKCVEMENKVRGHLILLPCLKHASHMLATFNHPTSVGAECSMDPESAGVK